MSRIVRVLVGLLVVSVAVWVLFTVVFPWVDRTLIDDPVLGLAGVGGALYRW
ncbi:hypothetical protein [Egibacter rhizosphaerae]|uniref:hypothetical protein n=1 Tax=Egibacter rhizosphaerae TaxID=1670831 RepID=UPI0013F1665B|nr:hypothetical protein [Egibacter rhizosphaerae]